MKSLIKEYLSSLKERDELDAILPPLLSELGLNVISRPGRGTVQHGVDIAAVGSIGGTEKKLYLLSVKRGNLTRKEWHAVPQGLRSSLDEIRDAYINTFIPPEYADLPIVICICLGGDIQEQVRSSVVGYMKVNETDKVRYEEWNGDRIAELILQALLKEELLPEHVRSNLRKAIAFVDRPDISYKYFTELLKQLQLSLIRDARSGPTTSRQIYIGVWMLFVWGRDIGNLEAAYRVSELSILYIWDVVKTDIQNAGLNKKALEETLTGLIKLHLQIAADFLDKIIPVSGVRDALAAAVSARSSIDANLALFECLGRLSMTGLWLSWLAGQASENATAINSNIERMCKSGFAMIRNNEVLHLPVADDQSTSIALFFLFWASTSLPAEEIANWLQSMATRFRITLDLKRGYPAVFRDYKKLLYHPRDRSDAYLKEATIGSTLIPLLSHWATLIGDAASARMMSEIAKGLPHCTMQMWMPAGDSEQHLYINSDSHGEAIVDVPIDASGEALKAVIFQSCKANTGYDNLSAVKNGFWPVVLLACKHWKYPIPPNQWVELLELG